MVKKTVLLLMIIFMLWVGYDAVSAFVDPSIANFMYIAELNSTSIDDYMSKNVEFIQTVSRRVIDHIDFDYVSDNLYDKHYSEFRQRDDGTYEYNNFREDYTIVSENDVKDLITDNNEFQMLFDLSSYLENFYEVTDSILRVYYLSNDEYMMVYPKQKNSSIYYKDFYKKYLDVGSSVISSSHSVAYMYEVYNDHITDERVMAVQSPIIIDNVYRGILVIEIKASIFDEITIKNFDSFATTNNLEAVIYYDNYFDENKSGIDILDSLLIKRNFLENPIRIDKYIRRLTDEQYLYFQKNKIIFAKVMDSVPIEYYQITDINYLFKDVKVPLFFLAYMVAILLYYTSYIVISRGKEYIDNRKIKELRRVKQVILSQVNIDNVTGLRNQNYLKSYIPNMNNKIRVCYSIALCNISFYDKILQKHGEKPAKKVLLRFIDIIKSIVPSDAIITRWNADELLILFPEKGEEATVVIVDEIRRAISILIIETDKGSSHVEVSFGVTVNRNLSKSPYSVIEEADKALNTSKGRGGNIVTLYSENMYR